MMQISDFRHPWRTPGGGLPLRNMGSEVAGKRGCTVQLADFQASAEAVERRLSEFAAINSESILDGLQAWLLVGSHTPKL